MSSSGISPALLERLGTIVIQWGHVEGCIGEIASRLLMADKGSFYVVTESVSTASLTEWCRTITKLRFEDGETKENILSVLDRVDAVRGERNVLTHGLWEVGPVVETAKVQSVRLDRTEMIKTILVTKADLDEVVDETSSLFDALVALIGALDHLTLIPNPNFD